MAESILIASSSPDVVTYGPVCQHLEKRGYPVVVYHGDKVISGEENLSVGISEMGELTIGYDGQSIAPADLGAAWFRKVGNFDVINAPDGERAKRMHLNDEVRKLHGTIWSLYPENLWLNAPDRNHQAQKKLGQLLVARELGFSIPETIVSSDWQYIERQLLTDDRTMVVKMIHGVVSDNDALKVLYTTPLDKVKLDEIRGNTVPFPGIYQPFLDKAREWRVTVVGDNVFSAAIYTTKDAKDDWRKHQASCAVQFKHEFLPAPIEEGCVQYIGRMGLKFGAFDFIETSDGEVVFLECNPNGQFSWLEDQLGFPISHTIADELIKIAQAT